MQGAAKVGFLVIVFLILLYAGYAILGKAFVGAKTNTYFADFADAAGANNGTTVTMAGVKIGTVSKVALVSPRVARMTLEIDRSIQIPVGSTATMGGSLIGIGATPLQIVPPKKPNGAMLPNGSVIPGSTSSAVESFLPPEAKQTLKELNMTLAATRRLMENQTLEKKLQELIDNSSKTLQKFGALADGAQGLLARTDRTLGQTQPEIQKAMHNASLAMADIHKSTDLLSKLIESGKYQDESLALLKQLNQTAAKANDLMANLNSFVTDPQMQQNLKSTMANVDKMSASGTQIAANTEVISKNGITLSEKALSLADKANAIADEAQTALKRIEDFFNKGGAGPSLPKVEAHLDLLRQTDPSHWRTDLYGRFDLGKEFVDAGLYDAFESNKVILQLGNPLTASSDYRYGIYASKPGLGVDFRLAHGVSLRTDLFDINDPQLDFRTQFDFGNGLVGWLGLERIFERNSIVAGVGIKR